MPDISMCRNEDCPINEYCYRFTAKPNGDYQTYADFFPMFDEDDKPSRDYFIDDDVISIR